MWKTQETNLNLYIISVPLYHVYDWWDCWQMFSLKALDQERVATKNKTGICDHDASTNTQFEHDLLVFLQPKTTSETIRKCSTPIKK